MLGQRPHPADIGLPFGHRNHPARVQQVEDMAGLDALVIGGMDHDDALAGLGIYVRMAQDRGAFRLGLFEVAQQDLGVGGVKVPARVFLFGLLENVAVVSWGY